MPRGVIRERYIRAALNDLRQSIVVLLRLPGGTVAYPLSSRTQPPAAAGMVVRICFILAADMSGSYFVYILASRSRTLYTGVANNLERRITEHRNGLVPGFTSRYRVFRLVHFEVFADIRSAIAREKEIKGWRREKKVWLIERRNRTWEDLAESLTTGE
jgi:putative endonuclease